MAIVDLYLAFALRAGAALKPLADPLEAGIAQLADAMAPEAAAGWRSWLARNQSALSRKLPLMNPVSSLEAFIAFLSSKLTLEARFGLRLRVV
jgi:hypothetical protein